MLNGAWAEHRLRGAVGGGVIQLDTASESALRAQPGYSGSPAIVSDSYGDTVIGMLVIASNDRAARDAYATPVDRLVEAWPEVLADRTVPSCPYRGLQAFTQNDAEAGLFVGREAEVEQLQRMVQLYPLTMVVGPSGVGKSSLVTAGLIPAIERDGWNTTLFRPGQLPFQALAKALLEVERPGKRLTRHDLTDLANQLLSEGLTRYAVQLRLLTGKSTLLYIDQFEETLIAGSLEERASFLNLVLPDPASQDTGLHIVCTMRADFFPHILDHPDCGPRLQGRILFLSPMGVHGLERVIREPAAKCGVEFEQGLPMKIARDAIAGGGLPILEFALTELWPNQHRRQISYFHYFTLGDVSARLSRYADQVFSELTEKYSEDRIRRAMLKLVRSREGANQATRRIVAKEALKDEWSLIEELARRRLVVLGSDMSGRNITAELAHEALIREWPRFETWVNEDSDFQRWLVFIEERDQEGELLSEARLEEAQNWQIERPDDIPENFIRLIELSKKRLERLAELEFGLIERSEERYRSLVQGGAQVVWVAAPDGAMTEDSPEWRLVTGQTQEQYTGFGWLESIHPEDRERVERDWRECVRTGKTFETRYRIRTKSGSYRHYDVRAVPIERDSKIVEWVGACTDVTSQVEAEEMRGRLTEQLRAAALRTARLQQATSMLAEALTVGQVVEVITEVGRTAIGALHSAVALLDADGVRLRVVNDDLGNAPDFGDGELTMELPSVMTKAIATRHPVLVEDPEDLRRQFEGELEIDPERVAASDERSWVGLPLLAAGAPLGALRFSFGRPRNFPEEERVFLEALAGQCSLAVERAGLYEREHTTAETLQRSLLPDQLPSVPGLVLTAMYRPVAKNMEIGGDWYDAFLLSDQRLAVAVGDVMGRGLPAAARMGRVRNALRALALTDPRPPAVLGSLDRLFSAEDEEQLTTVAYLVIDPESGNGVLGNAGHPPALVVSAGRTPRFDEVEGGTPLGWASPRKQHTFNLAPGSTAIFYSNGLVQNRNRGLDAGLEELAAVAARADDELLARPERFLEYLVERMLAGHNQDDDVTCIVDPVASALIKTSELTAPSHLIQVNQAGDYLQMATGQVCWVS